MQPALPHSETRLMLGVRSAVASTASILTPKERASAGGLEAIGRLFHNMLEDTEMVFVMTEDRLETPRRLNRPNSTSHTS